MKKLLLIIILFFCFLNYIKAETFYGNYRLVDNIGEYKDDLLRIEKLKLYNTYKNKLVDMGYMLENNKYIKDEKDFIEKYLPITNNDIGDEYIKVKSSKKTTFMIQFTNFNDSMKINEVEIYYQNKKIQYGFLNNKKEELRYIQDNDYDTYIDYNVTDSFYINLFNNYKISDITIKIYTLDNIDYKFLLSLGDVCTYITLHNKDKNIHILTFDSEDNETKYEYMGLKKLYKYYKEEKDVLNNYVEFGNNLLLDDYIEFDYYYIRDKLILEDIMIINNYDEKIEDFIKYSSDKVNTICNIDYGINGLYECEYILNDISVKKNILVNIPNIDEINLSNDVYIEKTNEISLSNDVYIENTNELINNEEEIEVKLLKNNINKEIKKDKVIHKNNLVNYIKYIIIFDFIIIEIILFFKKKKK